MFVLSPNSCLLLCFASTCDLPSFYGTEKKIGDLKLKGESVIKFCMASFVRPSNSLEELLEYEASAGKVDGHTNSSSSVFLVFFFFLACTLLI